MKKLLYVLLGAASAVIVRSMMKREERLEGAPPRPLPQDFNGEVLSAADELRTPAPEV